jgi:rSAM/selenodomain-associated transferase 2
MLLRTPGTRRRPTQEAERVRISVIIPALNEAAVIGGTLRALAPLRARGGEVVVVDGGSHDATRQHAIAEADRVIVAPRGRASQMNAGAAAAAGDVLVFVHADTHVPADADVAIVTALERSVGVWGRFDLSIDSRRILLRLVSRMMNARSRLTGIATGDQAMFVRRGAFEAVGGFPAIDLMEDVAMSRLLKRRSAPLCLADRVTTSARRWEANGVLRTIVLMWWLRWRFSLGASPAELARSYAARG